jgi:hypothetical protein
MYIYDIPYILYCSMTIQKVFENLQNKKSIQVVQLFCYIIYLV